MQLLCSVMVKTNWPEETTRQYREKSNSQTGNVNGRKKGKGGGGVGEMSIHLKLVSYFDGETTFFENIN